MINIFRSCSFGLLVIESGKIIYANPTSKNLLKLGQKSLNEVSIEVILPRSTIKDVIKNKIKNSSTYTNANGALFFIEMSIPDEELGYIFILKEKDYHQTVNFPNVISDLTKELNELMSLSGELVSITNGQGKFLRVNKGYLRLMDWKEHEIIGKSVFDLQKEGVLNKSCAAQVIKRKTKVTFTQVTQSGKRLLVQGYPIQNNNGDIEKVITIAKDITEENKLKRRLESTRKLMHFYQSELNIFKKKDAGMIAKSKSMKEIVDITHRISNVEATVLILGESGVGKEVIARRIHQLSTRNESPFIKINCGAIPENLIESELFGYSKGTFTGGLQEGKKGLISAAHKGVLFLDEIGELPLNLQVKLLQVLQDKQVTPLGETDIQDVDIRVIAATNRDLKQMVKEGKFRKDLYYRLNVIPITIPPLRERKEDIPFLINKFLDYFNRKYIEFKSIDKEVVQLLTMKKWEGNIRELENMIERLVTTVSTEHIMIDDLPPELFDIKAIESINDNIPLKEQLALYEKDIIENTLANSRTMKEASQKLGVNISTISRKVKDYNIDIPNLEFKT